MVIDEIHYLSVYSFRIEKGPDLYAKFLLHDVEKDIVSADIKLYLVEALLAIVEGRSDFDVCKDWPPKRALETLVRRADRLFIYAATACQYIGGGGDVRERLMDVASFRIQHSGLDTEPIDALYSGILERAYARSTAKETERLQLVLATVISIRDPLTIDGLGLLLNISNIRSILASLHSVISVPSMSGGRVSTFHASFADFMADHNRSKEYFQDASRSHRMLSKLCLGVLNASLRENICDLEGRPANIEIGSIVISDRISETMSYACIYWAQHLTDSKYGDLGDISIMLQDFLDHHILHWLECLSLLGRLDMAMDSLRKLESWVLDPGIVTILADSRHFVQENFDLISHYCLETYHSALAWAPQQSTIRHVYPSIRAYIPKVICGLQEAWGNCEHVITCPSVVYCVALSPDRKLIAAALENDTIGIWDAMTGVALLILEGHSAAVYCVAFSPDSSRIVSGSWDRTVRVWDAIIGDEEWVLEDLPGPIHSVAFAPDGHQIVCASGDQVRRIWDAVAGKTEHVLYSHSGTVYSVAFSCKGDIVSGSTDGTVRIWNAASQKVDHTLEGHSDDVNSVIFLPSGEVASAPEDATIQIWNLATGLVENLLEGHSGRVSSLTSPYEVPGRLVSGSDDKSIRIWNMVSGEAEVILEGHSDVVNSVAITSNGQHIVSGSEDKTIRIWNIVTADSTLKSNQCHSDSVFTVTFSPTGDRVASGSRDSTICIRNIKSGSTDCVLNGHDGSVICAAFSHDGHLVASGSEDRTVRVWNSLTGKAEHVSKRLPHEVSSVAFSPNGDMFASGCGMDLLIWNVHSGEVLLSMSHTTGYGARWLGFSRGGTHLMCEFYDATVQTWNLSSGESEVLHVRGPDENGLRFRPSDVFDISTPFSDTVFSESPFSVSKDRRWISSRQHSHCCWIPTRFRDIEAAAWSGSKVCFGHASGDVTVLDLTDSLPPVSPWQETD